MGSLLRSVAELCNGSTYDSDSYCVGSNPASAAFKKRRYCKIASFFICDPV